MRCHPTVLALCACIAAGPAFAGSQQTAAPADTHAAPSAPAPNAAQGKSRSAFGRVIAEMTQSIQHGKAAPATANATAAPSAPAVKADQVATADADL